MIDQEKPTRVDGCRNVSKNHFDYIIVGAGPSAIGLLYGILSSYQNQREEDTTNTSTTVQQQQSSSSSSLPPFSIAVVERGSGPPHDPLTQSPSRWYEAAHESSTNTKIFDSKGKMTHRSVTHVPTELPGRRINEIPIGQGIGGGSNINACLCTLPLQQDFHLWPNPWKNGLLPATKSIQQILKQNNCLHFHYGIQEKNDNNNNNNTEHNNQIVSPYNPIKSMKILSSVPTLVSQDLQKNGIFHRKNYYDALLEPFLQKYPHLQNLIHWFRGVEVQRLLRMNDKEEGKEINSCRGRRRTKNVIVGIECYSESKDLFFNLYSTNEVIVCAGAIETPALLLTSDIGGGDDDDDYCKSSSSSTIKSENLNNTMTRRLSGVGRNLLDQVFLTRVYLTPYRKNTKLSSNGIAGLGHLVIDEDRYQIGIADSTGHASIVPSVMAMTIRRQFVPFSDKIWFPLLKSILRFLIQRSPLGYFLKHFTITTMIFLLHPKSTGTVTIRRKEEEHQETSIHPAIANNTTTSTTTPSSSFIQQKSSLRRRDVTVRIDPFYMTDPHDMSILRKGWETTSQLGRFVEFFPPTYILSLIFRFLGLDWFQWFCNWFLLQYYHYCGTCRMETTTTGDEIDDNWVVDSRLRVRDYTGLRICDASVFPTMVSSPPCLTCVGLGYMFGHSLLKELAQQQETKRPEMKKVVK